jgi:hypothetical protein
LLVALGHCGLDGSNVPVEETREQIAKYHWYALTYTRITEANLENINVER